MGLSTLYAHLDSFSPPIEALVTEFQKKSNSYEIDLIPEPGKYPVSNRAFLGYMGNTGHSYGPHLHFEIREAQSDKMLNPAVYGIKPKDTRKPTIKLVKCYAISDQWQTSELWTQTPLQIRQKNTSLPTKYHQIGFGVEAFDQMNGASNVNGIWSLQIYARDTLIYTYTMQEYAMEENKLMDAFTCFKARKSSGKHIVKGFRHPVNNSLLAQFPHKDGLITLVPNQPTPITIIAEDIEGNKDILNFQVNLDENLIIPDTLSTDGKLIQIHEKYALESLGLRINIQERSFLGPHVFRVDTITKNKEMQWKIGDAKDPLFKKMKIQVKIPQRYFSKRDKLCFVSKENGRISFGEQIEDSILITEIRQLGSYGFYLDTVPPSIKPDRFSVQAKNYKSFSFSITDNVIPKGEATPFLYSVWIDGEWIACPFKAMDHKLTVPIHHLKKGNHDLLIQVTDYKNNKAVFKKQFKT